MKKVYSVQQQARIGDEPWGPIGASWLIYIDYVKSDVAKDNEIGKVFLTFDSFYDYVKEHDPPAMKCDRTIFLNRPAVIIWRDLTEVVMTKRNYKPVSYRLKYTEVEGRSFAYLMEGLCSEEFLEYCKDSGTVFGVSCDGKKATVRDAPTDNGGNENEC
jgi:hypothetical protein